MRFPPVIDDITLNFTPLSAQNAVMQPKGADGVASEPGGTSTILEALEKQPGLKLKSRKGTAEVLVVDHVDETTSENSGAKLNSIP